jgi:tetratricopeptide (TPR) repeat protein
MYFRNLRGFLLTGSIFLLACNLLAQRGGIGGTAGGGTTGAGSPTGGTTSSSGASTTTTSPQNNIPRPIFLTGAVVMGDGTPAESVKIERMCNGNTRTEGYTDRKGRFNLELGRASEFQDASMNGTSPFGASSQDPFQTAQTSFGGQSGMTERDLWNCEIRASLAGYRSDSVSLAGRRALDNPEIGTLVLRKLGSNVQGLTVSATSALAPKDAKKSLEKAMDAMKKRNPDEAQAQLEKAVAAYPKYATAWLELGKLQEQRDHATEAQKAYEQAIAADSKFLPPYDRLAAMALKASQWETLANLTDQILKLDPFSSPDAYYMNSIANLQLKHFDVSEKQATEAIKLDPLKKNMRAYYILGLAQASQAKYVASAASLKVVIGAAPSGVDLDVVRKQLTQVEAAAQQATSRDGAIQETPSRPPQ